MVDDEPSPEYAQGDLKRIEIEISVTVGKGSGSSSVWTCDLTKNYISINTDYRS